MVNHIKRSALNTRLLRELCKEFDASSENLLFNTEVRLLSRGNVFKRVFQLINSRVCSPTERSTMLFQFNIEERSIELAYLVDIFSRLNLLNLSMQGRESRVLDFVNKVNAFSMKLDLCTSQIRKGIYDQFQTLDAHILEKKITLISDTKGAILEHLRVLKQGFHPYFDDLSDKNFKLTRNPFNVDVESVPPAEQEEFIELINDSNAKDMFA